MTRTEIESEYRIKDGRIISPGKFEGQPVWVPVLWEVAMNGFADSDDGESYGFTITKKDPLRIAYPELDAWLGRRRSVRLIQSDSGFISAF